MEGSRGLLGDCETCHLRELESKTYYAFQPCGMWHRMSTKSAMSKSLPCGRERPGDFRQGADPDSQCTAPRPPQVPARQAQLRFVGAQMARPLGVCMRSEASGQLVHSMVLKSPRVTRVGLAEATSEHNCLPGSVHTGCHIGPSVPEYNAQAPSLEIMSHE